MYPELTPVLVVGLAAALGTVLAIALRGPVLRRLALRQTVRRRTEAVLVVAGSVLGTAMIVGSLVVGDTLNRSVKQTAYETLGPVDERVTSPSPQVGDRVGVLLASRLGRDPDIDGLLSSRVEQAAVVRQTDQGRVAEPRALVWEMEFTAASQFGAEAGDSSGLGGRNPAPGQVVINERLADQLGAKAGDPLTVYVYGQELTFDVARVVHTQGLAGAGLGATRNYNLFVPPGTLVGASIASGGRGAPQTVTFVSNRGGVESGVDLTDAVKAKIERALGGLLGPTATVETPKDEVLTEAEQTGDALGAMFLFIGSFSIIAGVLLLANVFVMLAEERKSQLGMLRAVGLTRRRLVGAFLLEGTVYALAATVLGVVLGIGVGWAVVAVAERIFASWAESAGGGGLSDLVFAVTPTSLVNGAALGFLIAFLTVLVTTVRISRINIIAAIRDLPTTGRGGPRLAVVVVSALLAIPVTAGAVSAVVASASYLVYLLPALALMLWTPLLMRLLPRRVVASGVPLAVLLWSLLANTFRPDVFDDATMATWIVQGVLLTFSAVFLITENQRLLLRPFRRLIDRPSEAGLAARLGTAYPVARRFRTGATLIMYAIVVFTLVLITQIGEIVSGGVDRAVVDASGGYALRVDYNSANPVVDPQRTLRSGALRQDVVAVDPLLTVSAVADDPAGKTSNPLPTTVVGVPATFGDGEFTLDRRLESLGDTDREVWQAVVDDPRYVLLDGYFGAQGGPQGELYSPGDTLTVRDPRTGRSVERVIAGIMKDAQAFYGIGGEVGSYPALMSQEAVTDQFGAVARTTSVMVEAAPGVSASSLAAGLQGRFLTSGLVATDIASSVEQNYAASTSFFRLMQGFLALGLLVAIAGLGVVMVKSVRERRRTIGVLRALGFRSTTIQRSFLEESGFVAAEGILVGTVLSVLTSYLLYRNSADFAALEAPFPIAWLPIAATVALTFLASLAATLGPARRAAGIRPALAVRVAE